MGRELSFVLLACLLLFGVSQPTLSHSIELIDRNQLLDDFRVSLSIISETLEHQSPPRYGIKSAEITFSITTGLDGEISGKIPVGIVGVEVGGEYGEIETTTQTYRLGPSPTIPVNFDNDSVLDFLESIRSRTARDIANDSKFIVTEAEYIDDFILMLSAEGKLTFLNIAAAGVSANMKNTHKIRIIFCLIGQGNNCYAP